MRINFKLLLLFLVTFGWIDQSFANSGSNYITFNRGMNITTNCLKFSDDNQTNSGIQFADGSFLYTTTNLIQGITNATTITLDRTLIIPNLIITNSLTTGNAIVTNNLVVSNNLTAGNALVTNNLVVSNNFTTGNALVTNNLVVSNSVYAANISITNSLNITNKIIFANSDPTNSGIQFADGSFLNTATNTSLLPTFMYIYSRTGTAVVESCANGAALFTATTQSISFIHIGAVVSGSVFQAATSVTNVDYNSRQVYINKTTTGSGSNITGTYYRANGIYTHTVPSGWVRCKVYVTGGGGSSGCDGAANHASDGGSAAGTSIGLWAFAMNEQYTITIGRGGTNVYSASASVNGITGGTSSFGTLQSATGGTGGAGTGQTGLAPAGLAYGGLINISGNSGAPAYDNYRAGTGAIPPENGGDGGGSFWGGGGAGGTSSAVGGPAQSYGAGGGGSGGGNISGAGAQGVVIVEYY